MNLRKKKDLKLPRSKSKIIGFTSVILVLALLSIVTIYLSKNNENKPINKILNYNFCEDLEVHMIDVGQGDCFVVKLPNSQLFLIDSGNATQSQKIVDYIKTNFSTNKIDYLLATHPDNDHIGGMQVIFEEFEIGYVFRPYIRFISNEYYNANVFKEGFNLGAVPEDFQSSISYYNFLKAIENEKCGWEFFNMDSDINITLVENGVENRCKIDFLTPTCEVKDISYVDTNDYSPLVLISFNEKNVLFTGDASTEVENEFLNVYSYLLNNLTIDILKLPHHGSNSTSIKFLQEISPEYGLISCGVDNVYGHPAENILDELFKLQTYVYRTDESGSVVAKISSDGEIDFSVEKQ